MKKRKGTTYVAIGQHDKVVSLDVEEGQDEESPAVCDEEAQPLFPPVLVNRVRGVDQVEQHVVEQRLEGGDRSALVGEEGRQRVGRGDANGQDYAVG